MEKWAKLALQKKMKVKIIPGPLHLVVTLSCDEQMRVRIRKGGNDGLGFGNKELFFLKLVFLSLCLCFHRRAIDDQNPNKKGS